MLAILKAMELLLGTNNAGKIVEMKEVFSGLPITVRTPAEIGVSGEPHEHGETYRDNAVIKATFFHEASGLPTLADDSGIVVDALAGELGVQTRRWGAGPAATDQEWIEFFLKRMECERNRRARFVCTLALIYEDDELHVFEGVCDGEITDGLQADYLPGLPISACFKPNGFEQVYSAMTIEQKNSTSHRGRALQKARDFLSGMH